MRAYVDSNVLIWHVRGERKAFHFLSALRDNPEYDLWIGAMQRAEIVFFMRPHEEEPTLILLSLFQTQAVDQRIVDEAGRIYRDWNQSHGVDANDALLAATARQTGGKIYTLNDRHFPMPDVLAEKAW